MDREPTIVAPGFTVLWRRPITRLGDDCGETLLVAAGGLVAHLAQHSVTAYNASDGSEASPLHYSALLGYPTAITASTDLFFLGTIDGYVLAIDPATTHTAWIALHHWPSTVFHLHLADGLLFAVISPSITYVLDPESGSSITDELPLSAYAWSPSDQSVIAGGIYSLSLPDNARTWETGIPGAVHAPPLFTASRIVVRAGWQEGPVYLLDRATGEVIATSSSSVISNLVGNDSHYFGLASSGALTAWDFERGVPTTLATFGSAPLDLSANWTACFQVAIDQDAKHLYVYLGDVSELFALAMGPTGP